MRTLKQWLTSLLRKKAGMNRPFSCLYYVAYLDLRWNRGRIWCRPGPSTFQGHSVTLTKYLDKSTPYSASISAQIAVCDVTAPIVRMVYIGLKFKLLWRIRLACKLCGLAPSLVQSKRDELWRQDNFWVSRNLNFNACTWLFWCSNKNSFEIDLRVWLIPFGLFLVLYLVY